MNKVSTMIAVLGGVLISSQIGEGAGTSLVNNGLVPGIVLGKCAELIGQIQIIVLEETERGLLEEKYTQLQEIEAELSEGLNRWLERREKQPGVNVEITELRVLLTTLPFSLETGSPFKTLPTTTTPGDQSAAPSPVVVSPFALKPLSQPSPESKSKEVLALNNQSTVDYQSSQRLRSTPTKTESRKSVSLSSATTQPRPSVPAPASRTYHGGFPSGKTSSIGFFKPKDIKK